MGITNQARVISHAFLNVFYPNFCQVCSKDLNLNERHLCLSCSYDLPYIAKSKMALHKLEQLFWGRVKVEKVFSLLDYQRGNQTQVLLHQLKYKKKKKLGFYFGQVLGELIPDNQDIDLIIPVPLHSKKLRQRGFNQSSVIAKGIGDKLLVPVADNALKRNAYNLSQTKFSKYDRWDNVRQIFSVTRAQFLEGKHVLLVDDVLTTGATLEACVQEFLKIKNCTVSIATLAARV